MLTFYTFYIVCRRHCLYARFLWWWSLKAKWHIFLSCFPFSYTHILPAIIIVCRTIYIRRWLWVSSKWGSRKGIRGNLVFKLYLHKEAPISPDISKNYKDWSRNKKWQPKVCSQLLKVWPLTIQMFGNIEKYNRMKVF